MNDNDTFTTETFADWGEAKALAATTVTAALTGGDTIELSSLDDDDLRIIEILIDADRRAREPGNADTASRTFVGGAK